MALYLLQYAYTSAAWRQMIKSGENEVGLARQVSKKLGGRVVEAWFTFGDYDVAAILDMPDHVTAAAVSVSLSAGDYAKAAKTTPLIPEKESNEILRKAKGTGVKPIRT